MNYHYLAGFIVCLILITQGAFAAVIPYTDNMEDQNIFLNPRWQMYYGDNSTGNYSTSSTQKVSGSYSMRITTPSNTYMNLPIINHRTDGNYSGWVYNSGSLTEGFFGIFFGDSNSDSNGYGFDFYSAAGIRLRHCGSLETVTAGTPDVGWYKEVFNVDGNIMKSWIYSAGGTLLFSETRTLSCATGLTPKSIAAISTQQIAYYDDVNYGFSELGRSVSASFTSDINKISATLSLISTSTAYNTTISDWNWLVNGVKESDLSSYTKTGITQLTDYNICLQAGDGNTPQTTSQSCSTINSGDWTAPAIFFTDNGQSGFDHNITIWCTDNNAGCKLTTYWTDHNASLNISSISTGRKDILLTGAGTHTLYARNTDNASIVSGNTDNNSDTNSLNFTTYGNVRFNIKDENSSTSLTGVTVHFTGDDSTSVEADAQYDINLASLTNTSQEYTFTFSKANYYTRTYTIDLNNTSDLNVTIALIPTSLGTPVPFIIYDQNGIQLYIEKFIEISRSDNNYNIGRVKTDLEGKATIYLKTNDHNYTAIVNNGEFTFVPILLTINYPKNENTLAQIDEKYSIKISNNVDVSVTDLNTPYTIYLLPYIETPYSIEVDDANTEDVYYSKVYTKQFLTTTPGSNATLQPYLIKKDDDAGITINIGVKLGYGGDYQNQLTIIFYRQLTGGSSTKTMMNRAYIGSNKTVNVQILDDEQYFIQVVRDGYPDTENETLMKESNGYFVISRGAYINQDEETLFIDNSLKHEFGIRTSTNIPRGIFYQNELPTKLCGYVNKGDTTNSIVYISKKNGTTIQTSSATTAKDSNLCITSLEFNADYNIIIQLNGTEYRNFYWRFTTTTNENPLPNISGYTNAERTEIRWILMLVIIMLGLTGTIISDRMGWTIVYALSIIISLGLASNGLLQSEFWIIYAIGMWGIVQWIIPLAINPTRK